jgi:hypothetical protein
MASAPGVEFFGLLATRYKYTRAGAWCKTGTRRAGARARVLEAQRRFICS